MLICQMTIFSMNGQIGLSMGVKTRPPQLIFGGVCVCFIGGLLCEQYSPLKIEWILEIPQYVHNGLHYVNDDFSSVLSYVTVCFGRSSRSNVRCLC